MGNPRVVLWDVGGVLLSNGWEESFRAEAARSFHFDLTEFERRHAKLMDPMERGQISLDDYLKETLFYEPRPFQPREVRAFIESCSTPRADVIEIARKVAATGRYLSACLNNEGRDLNEYRLTHFGLRSFLTLFFSSCFTGRRKPEVRAYELPLGVLGRPAEEVVFVDDRLENLEPARRLGMRAVHCDSPNQLADDLRAAGVRW